MVYEFTKSFNSMTVYDILENHNASWGSSSSLLDFTEYSLGSELIADLAFCQRVILFLSVGSCGTSST
jgi:hypothetical protein